MTHYVCPGCGSTSETAMQCETNGCPMLGTAMTQCMCEDGLHGEIMNKVS
jgi:hypothetical protein